MLVVKKGSTDVTTYVELLDSTAFTPETGYTITNLDLQYTRNRTAPAAKVDATALAATDTAHTDNRAIEVDATSSPGLYRIDWPDAAFATGVDKVTLVVSGAGLKPWVETVQLVDYDPADSVRLGLTALPNASPGASGGVVIAGSNAATTFATLTSTGTMTVGNYVVSGSVVVGTTVVVGSVTLAGVSITGGVAISQSTSNVAGVTIAGNGTGSGVAITAGATGSGLSISAAGGAGLLVSGTTYAANFTGGTTGVGLRVAGGSTSGDAVQFTATDGDGLQLTGAGSGNHDLRLAGSTTSSGTVTAAIGSGGITSSSFASGAITADAIAADAIGASELAAGAITEIQSGLATSSALTTVEGKIDTIDSNVDSILADTGTDGVLIASSLYLYSADIHYTVDDANNQDEYTVTWFKNGIVQTSGITSPTIQVIKRSDGSDLIAAQSMTQISSSGSYKYDASGAEVATAGDAYRITVTATIDGSTRTFIKWVSRDSA